MLPATSRREKQWAVVAAVLIMLLSAIPYVLGWLLTPAGYSFTGLLVNPLDGHSYLAKMGQGSAGSWLFHLPYSPEEHTPVLVYPYYLALGHLIPSGEPEGLVTVYHLARTGGGIGLLLLVYAFSAHLSRSESVRRTVLLTVGLSSGVGWLFGQGPDLTVPEAVTFPSLFVNSHFALTDCLMLASVMGIVLTPRCKGWTWLTGLGAVCLVLIQPLSALTVGITCSLWLATEVLRSGGRLPARICGRYATFLLSALVPSAYFLWILLNVPAIGLWMEQNVTASPTAGQWVVGYGLLIPIAAVGALKLYRRGAPADRLVLAWLIGQVLLMLVPVSLQRRLSTGLHIPVAVLAGIGLHELCSRLADRWRRTALILVLLLTFPSNALLMAAGVSAVVTKNPQVVVRDETMMVLDWIREQDLQGGVVLADTEIAPLVPSWGGGARVVYGHPFETPNAELRRQQVSSFYSCEISTADMLRFLDSSRIDLIVVDTSESACAELPAVFTVGIRFDPYVIYRRGEP